MKAKDVRRGNVILYNKIPHRVMDFHHHTPGNLRAMVQAKLRNLLNGNQTEVRFSSTEDLQYADMETYQATYMYSDADSYNFMNTETYEQIGLSKELVGDNSYYLHDGMHVEIGIFNGEPISINLPKTVILTIAECDPEMKGATASNSPKRAKTDTGLDILVPPFVKQGERVVINTETAEYMSRAE